jgi:hypothetical protein
MPYYTVQLPNSIPVEHLTDPDSTLRLHCYLDWEQGQAVPQARPTTGTERVWKPLGQISTVGSKRAC